MYDNIGYDEWLDSLIEKFMSTPDEDEEEEEDDESDWEDSEE